MITQQKSTFKSERAFTDLHQSPHSNSIVFNISMSMCSFLKQAMFSTHCPDAQKLGIALGDMYKEYYGPNPPEQIEETSFDLTLLNQEKMIKVCITKKLAQTFSDACIDYPNNPAVQALGHAMLRLVDVGMPKVPLLGHKGFFIAGTDHENGFATIILNQPALVELAEILKRHPDMEHFSLRKALIGISELLENDEDEDYEDEDEDEDEDEYEEEDDEEDEEDDEEDEEDYFGKGIEIFEASVD